MTIRKPILQIWEELTLLNIPESGDRNAEPDLCPFPGDTIDL